MSVTSVRFSAAFSPAKLRRILRQLGPLLREERPRFMAGIFGAVMVAAIELLRPWPLKWVFDVAFAGATPPPWLPRGGPELLLWGAGSLVLLGLLREAATALEGISFVTLTRRVLFRVRSLLHARMQRIALDFHGGHSTGDLLARLTGDVTLVSETISGVVLSAASTGFLALGIVFVLWKLDTALALVALAVVPALALVVSRLTWKLKAAVRRQRQNEGRLVSSVHEIVSGTKILQAFGCEEFELRRFEKVGARALGEGMRARKLQVAVEVSSLVLLAVGAAGVLVFGAKRVDSGIVTPGELLVFLAYLESLQRPLGQMIDRLARVTKAAACGERIVEILEREPRIQDAPDAIEAPALSGRIEFEGVTYGYAESQRAVRKVSFAVQPREKVVVVGPSGSGKSTLVNLLMRFDDPLRGQILLDGMDLRTMRVDSVRKQISTVFQEPMIFGLTIRENLLLGIDHASPEEIAHSLRVAQLEGVVSQLPEGIDTLLGPHGRTLSGGQQRLLAVARAVLRRAPILILDEPSAGLDAKTDVRLQRALDEVSQGRTTIVIAHQLSAVFRADRVLFLERGKIRGEGTHQQLYTSNESYKLLCDLQFGSESGMEAARKLALEGWS